MTRVGMFMAAVAAAGLLAGCEQLNGLAGKDTSAVAATVDGRKITEAQIDLELAGAANPKDPALRKAALERLVNRRLFAQAAHDEALDQSPEAKLLKQTAIEAYEAGLTERNTVGKLAEPTAAEVQAYIQQNPTRFGQRTVYLLDVLRLTGQPPANLAQILEPANTLAEAEAALKANNIPYERGASQADSLAIPPEIATQIAALKPGQAFVLPTNGAVTVNAIRASRVQPVGGPGAEQLAKQALRVERRNKALKDRLDALREAKKGKITYSEGYAPETPAAAS